MPADGGAHGCPLRQKRSWTLDFQFSTSMGRADGPWPDVMPRSTRWTRSAVGRALRLAFDQWCQCPTEAPVTMGGASGERSGGKGLRWAEGMGRLLSLFILLCLSMAVWNMFHISVRSSGSLWGSWFVTLLNSYLILSHSIEDLCNSSSYGSYELNLQRFRRGIHLPTGQRGHMWPPAMAMSLRTTIDYNKLITLQQRSQNWQNALHLLERICAVRLQPTLVSPWPARTAVWNKISCFIQVQQLRFFFLHF